MRIVYIAGPMRGIKDFNQQAFDAAADRLVDEFDTVINPVDYDRALGINLVSEKGSWDDLPDIPDMTLDQIIQRDIAAIMGATHIYMLKGWEKSTGARAEHSLAQWRGLTVLYQENPNRRSAMPTDAKARKQRPIASGVVDYFPDALAEVAHCSWVGNEQHNPGSELHWDRAKSQDEADALIRHFVERGTIDSDGVRHSAKVAWRALALLQKEIETDWQK